MRFDDKVFVKSITTWIAMIVGLLFVTIFKALLAFVVLGIVGLIYPDIMYARIKVNEEDTQEDIYKNICMKNRLKVIKDETPEDLYKRLRRKSRIVAGIFLFIGIIFIIVYFSMDNNF